MGKAVRLVALVAAAGFAVAVAQAADAPKLDCKSDKKCEEAEKAKAATKK
ncbi:MAG: hypothetical protein H7836_13915 [Magnetococcus sp. YQC-3]